jgi:hypothetical protein
MCRHGCQQQGREGACEGESAHRVSSASAIVRYRIIAGPAQPSSSGAWLSAPRGKPLVNYQAIVQLIAATTTRTGLNVKSEIDTATYPAGVKVSDSEVAAIDLAPHAFHGEWNYTIQPTPK